jgi:SNF2-related domain/Helicase conserved C-terminal domain
LSYRITVPRKVTTALDFDGAHFILHAPFTKDSWINELAAGSWDKKQNFWKLPPYVVYARTVLEQMPDVSVSPDAVAWLAADLKVNLVEMLTALSARGLLDSTAMQVYDDVLFPYQRGAVDRLVVGLKDTNLGAIFPGGGKTVVTLVAARLLVLRRVLIIAPKPLLRSWENEAWKFFGENWMTRCAGEPPAADGWVLTNYETVVGSTLHGKNGQPDQARGHAAAYRAVDWDLVVLDESVLVKNRNTKRFKEMLKLRKSFPRHADKRWWELSGSPTTRYADDLWAQLHLQDPKGFSSYWRFANRFCYVTQDVWGTEITGTRGNADIAGDLKDVMFVVSQKDVLPDLPEEIPQLVEVTLTPKQLKAYREMNDDFVTTLESGEQVWAARKGREQIILSKLIRLQQITSNLLNIGGTDESAKADAIVDMLQARSFAMPALIWTNWKQGAHALWKRLSAVSNRVDGQITVEYVSGDFKDSDNEEKFEAYKAGNIDILIVSLPVGKFGHNLQMTRTSIYHDKTWFADDYVQSMKRVKRLGLEHRPVVITLKAQSTVDQLIEDNLSGKFPGIAKVSNEDLAAMLRHLRGGS